MKLNKRNILFLALIFIIGFLIYTIIYNDIESEQTPKKDRIISTFYKNPTTFNKIVNYINEMDGFFSFYYNYDKKTYISKNDLGDSEMEILIDNDIENDFIYLAEELNFRYVIEGKDYILFIQEHSPHEQGIVYSKNNISGVFNEEIYIEDNWYYYVQTYE